ncbi:acyltransferase [Rhodococcus sp. Q1]|uniref:acyltransferase family protein n=1 Tax=Rhodococcus sp. Q1 TaxID=2508718 RepID=UPI001021DF87|nr:acyltransferase [Rhodococcus sp. Q1]
MNAVLPATSSAIRYAHIDAMRAVAVMLVVVGHAGIGHIVPGGAGVTIFFAISGFIITTLLLKEWDRTGGFDVGGFYTRRLVKLAPPLVVVLVIPTVVYAAVGGLINWSAFAGQVLFYFNWIKLDHPDVLPGSAVVWSLSIEEQFYIVFALLWLWLVKSPHAIRWLGLASIFAIAASTVLRVLLATPGNEHIADRIYYGSDTRADSLAWGILAALLLRRWQKPKPTRGLIERWSGSGWVLVAAVAVFLISLLIRDDWFRQTIRYTLQSITTCTVIIYGFNANVGFVSAIFTRLSRIKSVQLIGLSSYSIYLVHLSLIMVFKDYLDAWPLAARVVALTVLSTVVGILIYKLVEVPARKMYDESRERRTVRKKRSSAPGRHDGVEAREVA